MRPLKFRQMINGRFHYWGFLEKDCFVGPANPSDPSQQFTGLSDRNGKEIYEGDVVKWQSNHVGASQDYHIDAMTWDDMGACYLLMPWVHEPYAAEMEVIGNIYEHGELMEGKP